MEVTLDRLLQLLADGLEGRGDFTPVNQLSSFPRTRGANVCPFSRLIFSGMQLFGLTRQQVEQGKFCGIKQRQSERRDPFKHEPLYAEIACLRLFYAVRTCAILLDNHDLPAITKDEKGFFRVELAASSKCELVTLSRKIGPALVRAAFIDLRQAIEDLRREIRQEIFGRGPGDQDFIEMIPDCSIRPKADHYF